MTKIIFLLFLLPLQGFAATYLCSPETTNLAISINVEADGPRLLSVDWTKKSHAAGDYLFQAEANQSLASDVEYDQDWVELTLTRNGSTPDTFHLRLTQENFKAVKKETEVFNATVYTTNHRGFVFVGAREVICKPKAL